MSSNGLPSEDAIQAWATALREDANLVAHCWKWKRWTRDTIERLSIGIHNDRFTIPIRDGTGALVNLIRYAPDALRVNGEPKSLAATGAKRDLFPSPESIDGDEVWLWEGESDAITATALGLPAVGVPGTQGWKKAWAKRFEDRAVFITFDCEDHAQMSAEKVGKDLLPYADSVRIVPLDPTRSDGFDLGDFIMDAETPDEMRQAKVLLYDLALSTKPLMLPPKDGLRLTRASTVKAKQIEWLWHGRIPRSAITLILGMPGLGKSMLTCKVAAEASRRGEDVILMTAEDLIAETVVPRLKAEQADLDRVHFPIMLRGGFEETVRLPDDIRDLERAIREVNARVVIVDPLTAHFGTDVDSFRDQSVRLALAPLKQIAEATTAAFTIVAHLNKGPSTDPILRAGGSVGIIGTARSALLLDRDPGDPEGPDGDLRILAQAKLNLAKFATSLKYAIEDIWLPDDAIDTAKLVLTGESDLTSQDLLGKTYDRAEASKLEEAIEWLQGELANGPIAVKNLKTKCGQEGFSWATVEKAKQALKVTTEHVGFGSEQIWSWRLPDDGEPDDEED